MSDTQHATTKPDETAQGQTAEQPQADTQSSEDTGAQQDKSLDDILKEYESKSASSQTGGQPQQQAPSADAQSSQGDSGQQGAAQQTGQQTGQQPDPMVAELYREKINQELSEAAEVVKGDLPLSEEHARAFLEGMAMQKPGLKEAWQQRHTNKEGWNKVLKSINKSLAESLRQQPDEKATGDHEAVAAAVRTASNKSSAQQSSDEPSMSSLSKMTEAQFEQFKRGGLG